ncbi:MAG: hypothetical protein OP8BY_0035 [Candidatus Saccharicenans subterraneus]|uniref:Uncharacterized protein n=1 Tax=Candidatus Saccharicenans subterraneus TaxID=2508984 RepID=A0A3E2BLP3_9BACT|nr:MAG: hypothetical protein OP8BY_0035 [Candidatus Saccharicenans subterraneum]
MNSGQCGGGLTPKERGGQAINCPGRFSKANPESNKSRPTGAYGKAGK